MKAAINQFEQQRLLYQEENEMKLESIKKNDEHVTDLQYDYENTHKKLTKRLNCNKITFNEFMECIQHKMVNMMLFLRCTIFSNKKI